MFLQQSYSIRRIQYFAPSPPLLQDSHTCKHESLWGSSRNSKQFERKGVKEEKLIVQVSHKLSPVTLTIIKSMFGVVPSFTLNDFYTKAEKLCLDLFGDCMTAFLRLQEYNFIFLRRMNQFKT